MIYSTAHITIIRPNKPDVFYSLAIQHEHATNGLQAAVIRLKRDFGYPIALEKIAPGFKSAELELSDGRIIKVEMENYYRVWYKNSKGEMKEYAHGLTLDEAKHLVTQLKSDGFEGWYEAE